MIKLNEPLNKGGLILPSGSIVALSESVEETMIANGTAEAYIPDEGESTEMEDDSAKIDEGAANEQKTEGAVEQSESVQIEAYTVENLKKKRSEEIKKIATSLKIPTSGSKDDLINKIIEVSKRA